jgi:hypothetical protein
MSNQATLRRSSLAICKFCKSEVNLDDEGVQYRDGSAAHEECDDCDSFNKANSADFRD